MTSTDLASASLTGGNFHEALSFGVKLSKAKFSLCSINPAKSITQTDLDLCQVDPDNPSDLTGVHDIRTKKSTSLEGQVNRLDWSSNARVTLD